MASHRARVRYWRIRHGAYVYRTRSKAGESAARWLGMANIGRRPEGRYRHCPIGSGLVRLDPID